ncbi:MULTISPECIES: dipeptide/oligopeptide/nickel ABC transporter permease/ATP-binding protein [unclassified Micromonospora]|uniref:dipeptide/oligopeptide/nickel ABC transporter permease/ATP-binding protein n=1 Tax=unclassified Micromonospora TaxID=2617518 RepID=UPI001C248864|nr:MULTISPECIES: dipeptide/oligopeptide/nickel ABC transporter permease/ATP-binding protein [unclassified Micromonospora]MBU8860404.1 dipeptide/oligopeptide/nickel ABC transporter permease/ATP-binding protein [Micromonospora sp. WMMB482]MDM4779941.1 dipeptide/oligopeptide/nickel ABC transporter permease/ATP-binding protein [Micromonospora sp. b486]
MRRSLTTRLSRPGMAFARLGVAARFALGFVALIVVVGVLAPLLLRHDPTQTGLGPALTGPNGDFWFGLDKLGRDVFSRLVAGTRRSLVVGFGAAGIALVLGAILGAIAGSSRTAVDEVIMRCLDVVMAFPAIVLSALLIISFGKNSLLVLVVAIGFVFTPSVARIVRANVLSQYGEDYVAAERIIGARRPHILWRHVLRNCAAPILVFVTVMVADAIVFEASLSFIGGGLAPQEAASSWGSVIAFGKEMVQIGGWWATFFPGLLILLTVLALNVLSEGMSDAWAAPAARRATTTSGDALEQAQPGTGEVVELPGLAEAAQRLRERARPLPQGKPVLQVSDLSIGFEGRHRGVDIVDGLSFDVRPGEVVGLVGESGSGKSLSVLAVMGLLPEGARVRGGIRFQDTDLLKLNAKGRRALMGREIAMVYQDALSALNPALRVGAQLAQMIRRGGTRSAEELMRLVGLDPRRTLAAYPHELSGGQRQRVVIAMALSRDPKLIIADEPTTALDVTVQAQVMKLLLDLRERLGFALILVSHDLALVSDVCDRVVVMYGGQIVETGVTADVMEAPAHHYARGLLGSVLSLETGAERLTQIRGVVPSPADFPKGCRFSDRCPMATGICRDTAPALEGTDGHGYACHHPAVTVSEKEPAR